MNQRTILLLLAVVAVLALAGVVFLSIDSFGLFGASGNDPGTAKRGPDVDPFAQPSDPTAGIKFDGTDEHGRYITGPGGEHIYVDSNGRRYVLGPNGKRQFVNQYGQPVDGKGRLLRPDDSGRGPGKFGDDRMDDDPTQPQPDDPPEEELKPAELTGQVVDDAGKPYPLATITAQVTGGESATVTSGEEGLFKFTLPAEKIVTLTASDAWGNTSKALTTKLAPGPIILAQPLVLPRDTAIRGVVRDADTGLPLEGAAVQLLEGATHSFKLKESQSADAGGAFAFLKVTPMAYRLQVSRDGYAPRILNSVEPPANLTIEMSAGAVITGTVADAGGNPIAGATISCDFRSEPAQYFHTEAISDDAGYYVVKCQPESQHNTVKVLAAGFKSDTRTFVKSGSGGIDFRLEPSGNVLLRGRLLRADLQPVTSATFAAYAGGMKMQVFQSVGPGADGAFWCEVSNNIEELRIQSPGLAEMRVDVNTEPGTEVDLGDLVFDSGYAVFGIVHEEEGLEKPIKGADVSVGSVHVTTGDDGKYRIEGLGATEFIVRTLHPAFLGGADRVTPTPGQHEIELNIVLRKAVFEARVLVKNEQGPLAGVKCTLTAYGQVKTTGEDGLAKFTGVAAVELDAVFEKTGYAKVSRKIQADVSEAVASAPPQEVLMVPGAIIDGVCTSNASPLPGATKVEVWDAAKLVATLMTDTEGAYTTEPLPLGRYYVGLPDYHYVPQPVELTEEGAAYDIEVGAICNLRGKLLRADGQPHANAGVYIYRRDEVYWCATIHTGPDGKYEVTNLFPGEWVFCALKTQGDTAAQFAVTVSVSKPGWTDKDVQLPQITGVITGHVTYPNGQPVKRARVSVTNLSAQFPRALLAAYVVTDDNGYYTAERLENGAQMQARVGGYQDEATTGTAFSEVVTMPSDNSPVEADIVVAPEGVSVNVTMRRADGGPCSGGSLCYLFDEQGRMSGLYFGGGGYVGTIHLYDVVPGTYTLVVTFHGMKRAELQLTVGSEPITTGLEVLIEPHVRSGE